MKPSQRWQIYQDRGISPNLTLRLSFPDVQQDKIFRKPSRAPDAFRKTVHIFHKVESPYHGELLLFFGHHLLRYGAKNDASPGEIISIV
jgi:hypothetical protein